MLNPQQVDQYQNQGYLILPGFFLSDELNEVESDIAHLVEGLAQKLVARGKFKNLHADKDFLTRLTALEKECPGISVKLHTQGILTRGIARLWSSEKLLDLVETFIGSNIVGHPVWNIRSKTPLNPLATVPWHQDCAYLAPESRHTLQPTAWIPLVDVNSENGCLQVLPGQHQEEYHHRMERETGDKHSWYLTIDDEKLLDGDVVTCEMNKGDLLLINQMIPHRSTENYSDIVRWSLDFRWQDPALPAGAGNKKSMQMRLASNPDFVQDWQELDVMNRNSQVAEDGKEIDNSFMGRWA